MKYGVVFPQTEIGSDPIALRDYAQAAEDLGYDYLLAYDHVIGVDPGSRPGWRGPYTYQSTFHEPFVFYGYLAAITKRLELVTGIIILPQRQTVLVAKQTAEVDILSGGRLRLGVGLGWNDIEYEALNEDFETRGRRLAEQVRVLRALWTQELVEFKGKWHSIPRAGIKPLPVQRPIPVWVGGMSEPAMKRAARIGDGWFPQFRQIDDATRETLERMRGYVRENGRDPSTFGIDGRISISFFAPDDWGRVAEGWREIGATHLGVNTMGAGLATPQDHIDAIRRFREAMGANMGGVAAAI